MSATGLLAEAAAAGVEITRRGDRLSLRSPTAPPAGLLARLRQAKVELLAGLPDEAAPPCCPPDATNEERAERAAIAQYDGGLSRAAAEALAGITPPQTDDGPHQPSARLHTQEKTP